MWLTKAHTSQEVPTSTSGSSSLLNDKNIAGTSAVIIALIGIIYSISYGKKLKINNFKRILKKLFEYFYFIVFTFPIFKFL